MKSVIALLIAAVSLVGQQNHAQVLLGMVDQPLTPTDSPGGGTYGSTQSVTLSDPTSALILYTTNGSTPACPATGTLYTGTISVSVTTTIKAIGCNGVTGGGVLTSTYTITAGGAITLVHANPCTGNPQPSGTPCSITSITSGSSLIVAVQGINAANTVTNVTDSAGDTFLQVASCQGSTSGAGMYDVWWVAAATAGSTSVTVTTGASGTEFTAYEVNKVTAVDAACQVINTQGPSTTPASPSLTNVSPISFVVAGMAPTGNCTGITGAFTNDNTTGGYCQAHLITSAAGANQATWTASNSTYGSNIVSFKN